jgi:hypothetical protein
VTGNQAVAISPKIPSGIIAHAAHVDRWVLMNSDGAVLSFGAGGIRWNHPESGKSGWLIRELEGKAVNGINEMWPDGTGGMFFGTNDIEMVEKAQPSRPTAIYRMTVDSKITS